MTGKKRADIDPNNVTVNFTVRLDDENPKMRKIAQILREGRAIDEHGLFRAKGRDLCMYALELFDHLSKMKGTRQHKEHEPSFIVETLPNDPIDVPRSEPKKETLADMGLEDFCE